VKGVNETIEITCFEDDDNYLWFMMIGAVEVLDSFNTTHTNVVKVYLKCNMVDIIICKGRVNKILIV
jgi:hypothetical protein